MSYGIMEHVIPYTELTVSSWFSQL